MDIMGLVRDYGVLVIGVVLSGMLGILWYDLREQRNRLSRYVKLEECQDKRGMCAAMREAMSSIVETHSLSLQSMQDIFRNQTECLARLDERVGALREGLAKLYEEIRRAEARRGLEDSPVPPS